MTESLPSGRVLVDVVHALASMQTGALIECSLTGPLRQRLEDLAATIPSLFGAGDLVPLERVLSRLETDGTGPSLREVLFVSGEYVHVLTPLSRKRGVALVATSPGTNSVGLVLSAVHQRVAALEAE